MHPGVESSDNELRSPGRNSSLLNEHLRFLLNETDEDEDERMRIEG